MTILWRCWDRAVLEVRSSGTLALFVLTPLVIGVALGWVWGSP